MPHLTQTPAELAKRTIVLWPAMCLGRKKEPIPIPHPQIPIPIPFLWSRVRGLAYLLFKGCIACAIVEIPF